MKQGVSPGNNSPSTHQDGNPSMGADSFSNWTGNKSNDREYNRVEQRSCVDASDAEPQVCR